MNLPRRLLVVGWFLGTAGWVGHAFGGSTPLTTTRVATGLVEPVYVTHAPGDTTRVFIVEQVGRIRILNLTQDPPVLLGTPFLNIIGTITSGGEQGLLGLAFHPNYGTNGFFYVYYTRAGDADNVVARYTVSGNPDIANAGSAVILLIVNDVQANHNGGWIAFGPDGYLYIATGDGGGANDEGSGHTFATGNAQDITTNLLGKMLRIDVDGPDAFPADPNKNYAIPPTNPFVGLTGDDEIWAYGLRNPWRDCFDSATGDLYIADVGQGSWEEVNFQPGSSTGGENWGWRCREGAHNFNFQAFCGALTLLDPIHEYSHGFGCSITGGEVYRGCRIPDLSGTYFFSDYCFGTIWSFVYTGSPNPVVTNRTAELDPPGADTIDNVSSFGRDALGEVYICDHFDGQIFKIIPASGGAPCNVAPPTPTVGDDVCVSDGTLRGTTPCSKSADCPAGQVCRLKNRYISFNPADGFYPIKVTCTGSPDPTAVGQSWWVGAPAAYPDAPSPSFAAADLSCAFETHDFSHVSPLHVYGQLIMPQSVYSVEACADQDGPCSSPLVIETAIWGDVDEPMGNAFQPDFADIADIVDKFQGNTGSISKTRAQLQDGGVNPSVPVSFLDIATDVDAFQSAPFPYVSDICGG